MLAHGLMDNNVPPLQYYAGRGSADKKRTRTMTSWYFPMRRTWLRELIRPYMMRKRWDYFVKTCLARSRRRSTSLKLGTDPGNGGQLGF